MGRFGVRQAHVAGKVQFRDEASFSACTESGCPHAERIRDAMTVLTVHSANAEASRRCREMALRGSARMHGYYSGATGIDGWTQLN
jgi:hypothetical protein